MTPDGAPTHTQGNFDVHPSVVFKLGEDLITDEIQALAELIKNSYDADATWVVIRINTHGSPEDHPEDEGWIEIEDNGIGMDIPTIQRGWLTISNSPKREMKKAGIQTKRGRTPLGDKGLGRLGAQRLGNRVTIDTTLAGTTDKHELTFDWRDFANFEALSKVKVNIETTSVPRKGTKIVISDLTDPQRLADKNEIQLGLTKVISPYGGVEAFKLTAIVNGESIELGEGDDRLRSASVVRYHLDFDGAVLHLRGQMRLTHLRPNAKAEQAEFHRLCEADGGKQLFEHLMKSLRASDFRLQRSRQQGWWIEFEQSIALDAVEPVLVEKTLPYGDVDEAGDVDEVGDEDLAPMKEPASPGPFTGEVDLFNLSAGAIREVNLFESTKVLKDLVKELHGIRIYRDGFNVRVDEDWLGLGRLWSEGGSWYGLRPATSMGYIALSAADNSQLVETTDREGFVRTPHYVNFEKILRAFVSWTSEVQEFIGRGAVEYRKLAGSGVEEPEEPEGLLERLAKTIDRSQGFLSPLQELRARLDSDAREAEELLDRLAEDDGPTDEVLEVAASLNALTRHAASAAELVSELEAFVADLAEQRKVGVQLQHQLESLDEQLTLAYDTVAVGLTAEALSHEIANITERLARRTTDIARHVQRNLGADRKLSNYVEHVRGSIAGLRRQLAHLAPSLRYVRERRETLRLSELVEQSKDYFESRWDRNKLRMQVQVDEDFSVHMNRGKLLQVFDNLLLNSEYWVLEHARLGRIESGLITVRIDAPFVYVSDNGPGVDSQIESSLFEPFSTKKPRGHGRGLGLFIVRQLLNSEGCDIGLSSARNKRGRRYVFEVDMVGVVTDG